MTAKYMSFDPGSGLTGWASFDETGSVIDMGTVKYADLHKWLDEHIKDLEVVIIEDYKNHGWMNQPKWSRNETSKIIGAIELICEMRGIKYVLQPNTIKAIGYKWAGKTVPKTKALTHDMDAYVHGVYYLQMNGIRKVGAAIKENDK